MKKLLVLIAGLIIGWCLLTVEPIPAQSCSLQTFDGSSYGSIAICN